MDQPYEDLTDSGQALEEAPEDTVEETEPQLVRIKVMGKVLFVTEDVADAIQAREVDFNNRLSAQGAELGRWRQTAQPREGKTREERDLEYYQSPSQAIEEALAERDRYWEQALEMRDLERRYWDAFYAENPRLVGRERLVNSTLQEHLQHLSTLPPAQSRKLLADSVYELLTPVETSTTTRRAPKGQVVAERAAGSPPPARRPATTTSPEPYSGTAIINKRREKLRRAMYKTPKG